MSEAKATVAPVAPVAVAKKTDGVRLWSPRGNLADGSTHLALLSGPTFRVPHDREGIVVPKLFRREAIAQGCIPVGMEEEIEDGTGFDRAVVIRQNLQKMLDDDAAGLFTTDGKPALTVLSKLCGFQLARSEVNRVWDDMHKDDASDEVETFNIGAAKAGSSATK